MVIAKAKKLEEKQEENLLISNLKVLMQEQKLSEGELSRRTGIPQPTLHKILSGQTADPRISTLKILADYFEIPLDTLCSKKIHGLLKSMSQGKHVPVVSWSDCLDPEIISNLSPNNWTEWVIIDANHDDSSYAVISRPFMEPRFPKGTVLIVDPTITPSDGDLVIVQYPNTPEAALRELSLDGPKKLLTSLNQNSSPEILENKIKMIGTVVQSRFCY